MPPKRFPRGAIWYTGRKHAHERLESPRRFSPQEQLGFGIHFARSKEFAHLYGNFIYHCLLSPVNVLNIIEAHKAGSKEHQMALEMYRGTGYRLMYWGVIPGKEWGPITSDRMKQEEAIERHATFMINPDIATPRRAESIIRKYGYDAVFYEAKFGHHAITDGYRVGMKVTNQTDAVVILDPAKVKIVRVEEVGE